MRPRASRSSERGLTLAELLVVLAILATVAAVSATAAVRSGQAAALRAGADWTATVLRQATRAAWVEHAPIRIQFHPGTPSIAVHRWTGAGWVDISSAFFARWLPNADALPQGVVIASTTYPQNLFVAHPVSLPAGGTANVFASVSEGQVVVLARNGATLRVITQSTATVSIAP